MIWGTLLFTGHYAGSVYRSQCQCVCLSLWVRWLLIGACSAVHASLGTESPGISEAASEFYKYPGIYQIKRHFHPCPAISSHFHQLWSHFQLFSSVSSLFEPFTAIVWPFPNICSHSHPLLALSSHSRADQLNFENTWTLVILGYIEVTSWDSMHIHMCCQMQAPHWSQSHFLDSQWVVVIQINFYFSGI